MRSLIAIGFVLALVGLLNGCGSGGDSPKGAPQGPGQAPPQAPSQADAEKLFVQQIKIRNELAKAIKDNAPEAREKELKAELKKLEDDYRDLKLDNKTQNAIVNKYRKEYFDSLGNLAGADILFRKKK
jgi:hypothetical protein